ncbi:unnamed protein product [Mycena citricolor]|uniref:Chromo domain-containing protein n=1 Tax=Mycena citricolor TaxID=2018698 RepID=A0AAD2HDG8_9AGAR|nr:unnamed protein product [Mycena citricolor]
MNILPNPPTAITIPEAHYSAARNSANALETRTVYRAIIVARCFPLCDPALTHNALSDFSLRSLMSSSDESEWFVELVVKARRTRQDRVTKSFDPFAAEWVGRGIVSLYPAFIEHDWPQEYLVKVCLVNRLCDDPRPTSAKWAGFTDEHDSWEPASTLTACEDLLRRFWDAVGHAAFSADYEGFEAVPEPWWIGGWLLTGRPLAASLDRPAQEKRHFASLIPAEEVVMQNKKSASAKRPAPTRSPTPEAEQNFTAPPTPPCSPGHPETQDRNAASSAQRRQQRTTFAPVAQVRLIPRMTDDEVESTAQFHHKFQVPTAPSSLTGSGADRGTSRDFPGADLDDDHWAWRASQSLPSEGGGCRYSRTPEPVFAPSATSTVESAGSGLRPSGLGAQTMLAEINNSDNSASGGPEIWADNPAGLGGHTSG